MNVRVFIWSLTAALAGFLFGFDTVVISGAEKTIQSLWGLSPGLHGFAIASALYGTVVGSLFGGWPADRRTTARSDERASLRNSAEQMRR
jgi:MFS transporter, SP family, arabinose:H+ symporter